MIYRTLAILGVAVLLTGCIMPNRKEQVARNEAILVQEGITALEPGDPAPEFSRQTAGGHSVVLSEAIAQQRLVLFFFPATDTPASTRNLQTYSKEIETFNAHDIALYAVSPSTEVEHRSYAERYQITIPLISDPSLDLARQYGCAAEDAKYPQRTAIGIGPDGTVEFFIRGFATAQEILAGFGIATDQNGS